MFHISRVSPLYFSLALLCLLLSLYLRATEPLSERFLMVLLFGFLGMTLTGAMYQIIPNSQSAKLYREKLAFLSFPLALLSSLSFLMEAFLAGSLLLFASLNIFLFQSLKTIKNPHPPTVRFLILSAFFLYLSSLFLVLHYAGLRVPLQLAVHTLTVGSMLSAIYGVEFAWVPMLLMESVSVRIGHRLFYMKLITSLLFLSAFFLMNYSFVAVAGVLEFLLSLYFIYIIFRVVRSRRSPAPVVPPLRLFLSALPLLPLGLLAGIDMASRGGPTAQSLGIHIDLLVFGFAGVTIMGGMSHLMPRIMWQWLKKGGIADYVEDKPLRILSYSAVPMVLTFSFVNLFGFSFIGSLLYLLLLALLARAVFWRPLRILRT